MSRDRTTIARNQILVGDAAARLHEVREASVDMVLTSPPYFRLRDYGASGQLGSETHVDEWVEQLRVVFRQVRPLLTQTGTLWLNLGDTYSTHASQGAARKSLLLGPERLVRGLVTDGWHLRNKVIWQKTNPVPTSVADRLTTTWEVVYLLTPNPIYYFDLDSIRTPHRSASPKPRHIPATLAPGYGHERWRGSNADSTTGLDELKRLGRSGHPLGKNPGDVWPIATSRAGKGHHATFPIALADRAIRAGCPERRCSQCTAAWLRRLVRHEDGTAHKEPLRPTCACGAPGELGLVLDPFMGLGSTAIAAEQLGREWLGIELNPEFARAAESRIASARARGGPPARASPAA
jgi:site-specific DNA-methyltransferase (adenine-specific)